MIESRWARVALAFGAWTLVAVLSACQAVVGATQAGRPLAWSDALSVSLVAWYVRGALSPLVVLAARTTPVLRLELPQRVLAHVGMALLWSVVATMAIDWTSTRIVGPAAQLSSAVELGISLLTYAALLGLAQGADYLRQHADREITASRLEARLATARLDLLRMQLNPHFLSSALRDISELMSRDTARAARMIDELSELVRLSLRYAGEAQVPLSEEVGFLRRYLELEQMRFHGRLETHVDVASDALSARVPYLILQPLVENAVRHGVAPHVERGRVEVRGRADGEALVLEVYDDRPATPSEKSADDEIASLRATDARLRENYGESHRLQLTDLEGGGLCVRLELPLRRGVTGSPSVQIEAQP